MTDPLDGAAIGETRTLAVEIEQPVWDFWIVKDWIGSDRDSSNIRLTDVEFVNDPGDEQIVFELEADVTKQLPRKWDQPITEHPRYIRNQPQTKSQRLRSIVLRAIPTLVAMIVTVGVAMAVMSELSTITVNGEPVMFSPVELLPVVALVMGIAALIYGAMLYKLGAL